MTIATITKNYTFTSGVIKSSEVNADFDTVYSKTNELVADANGLNRITTESTGFTISAGTIPKTLTIAADSIGLSDGDKGDIVVSSAGSVWTLATDVRVPAGTIIDFGGSTAPAGYLLCDGAAVSRTTYADLFTAIGTLWGSGNGTTTFNVPSFTDGFATLHSTSGTVGVTTAGTIAAHTHNLSATVSATSSGGTVLGHIGTTAAVTLTGTPNNLAAGKYVRKCIKT